MMSAFIFNLPAASFSLGSYILHMGRKIKQQYDFFSQDT